MRKFIWIFQISAVLAMLMAVSACGNDVDGSKRGSQKMRTRLITMPRTMQPQATLRTNPIRMGRDEADDNEPDDLDGEDDNEFGEDESDFDEEEFEPGEDEIELDDDESEFDEDENEPATDNETDEADGDAGNTDDGNDGQNDTGNSGPDSGSSNPGSSGSSGGDSAGAPGLESSVGHGIVEGQEGHPHHAIETQSGGFAVIGESAVESSVGERMTAYLLVTDAATNVIFKADVGQGAWSNGNHVLQLPNGEFLVGGSVDTSKRYWRRFTGPRARAVHCSRERFGPGSRNQDLPIQWPRCHSRIVSQ